MAIVTDRASRKEPKALHPEEVRRARKAMVSEETLEDLAETFAALADSSRVKILIALCGTDLCVADLAVVLGVTKSAVSQHLRLLRSLRWVKGRRDGKMVYYSLDDEHVRDLLNTELEHLRGR
jgi:DNA-binding transcriptional ArsR family regulator